MFERRRVRMMLAATALVAITVPVAVGATSAGGQASATSTKHHVVLRGNTNIFSEASPAIEPKAQVKITCDSSTNTYTVTVKNVSVIDGYQNPFPKDVGQYYVLLGSPAPNFYEVLLSQNPTTALYGGSSSGILRGSGGGPFPADECFSGAMWHVDITNATYGTAGSMS